MEKTDFEEFKTVTQTLMKEEFKKVDQLSPKVFYLRHDEYVMIQQIAPESMSSIENKELLAQSIKEICQDPIVRAAVFISEVNIRDNAGNKKADGLMQVFSSFSGDTITMYRVDSKNREILNLEYELKDENVTGRFTGWFQWNKN
jgi:hypothetical protein